MADWKVKPLGDVCTLQRGFDLPTQDRRLGAYPLVSSSGIVDTHDEGRVQGPGVITGRSGSIGNVFYVEEDFWPLNTALYVRDFHDNNPRFVYYVLTAFDLRRYAGGTGVPTLNRNDVHNVTVLVPDSVREQRRIVAILDEAFEAIGTAKANTEKNLQNARELLAGYIDVLLAATREAWSVGPLSSFVESISTGPFGSMLHKSDYVTEGVPLVNPINILDGRIVPTDDKRIDDATVARLRSYLLQVGDIVVGRRGEIGRCAVVSDEQDGWLCGTGCFFIRPSERLEPEFIAQLIRSHPYREKLEALSTGATMQNLSNDALSNLQVAIPNRSEQKRLLVDLGKVCVETDRLRETYECKLANLDELKKSLLHQAFSGKL